MCRRIINSAFAVMLLCLMLLSGCTAPTVVPSDNPKHTDNTPIEEKTEVFAIKQIGDNTYINFDAGNEYQYPEFVQLATVQFKSLAEMKNAIKNNKFTPSQAAIIKTFFPKDSNGIKICNPDRLYKPVLPDNLEYDEVSLSGEMYSFLVNSNSNFSLAFFHYMTKDVFDRSLKNEFDLYSNHLITITSVQDEMFDNLFTKTYYYYTKNCEMKSIAYTIDSNGKKLQILEKYTLKAYVSGLQVSNTIPDSVYVFGTDNNLYFELCIHDPTSRPTVNWLSQIGIEEFKD